MSASQHSIFYRPDALPDVQPTVSKDWKQKLQHCCAYLSSGRRPQRHLLSPLVSARASWWCRQHCVFTIPHRHRCRQGRKRLKIGWIIRRRSRGSHRGVEDIPSIHCQIRAHHRYGLFSTCYNSNLQETNITTLKSSSRSKQCLCMQKGKHGILTIISLP